MNQVFNSKTMNINSKLGNYPGILITVSLTVALFLIGFCGWLAITSKEFIKYVKQNVELQVFLKNEADSVTVVNLRSQLLKMDIADITNNGPAILYKSKEEAAEVFLKETGEDFREALSDNPLFNHYTVRLKEEHISSSKLSQLKQQIEAMPGVAEVDYPKDFLQGVITNINKIYKIVSVIVLIFFVATLLLINNTIKLALYSQRFIIRTMQLVGATDWFIQKPFLRTGLLQGLFAGILSVVLIYVTVYVTTKQIEGLSLLGNNTLLYVLFGILLILGPLVGTLSTYQSVARYNKMELDKLY